jgi:hypothetical protein
MVVLLVSCSGLLLQASTLSIEALRLDAICASVCPAALCVFTTLQSTGSFEVENIEHPESPAATINSAEAVEIQSTLREFRRMIFLPDESERLFDFPRNCTNGALLSLVAEIRKDLLSC